MEDVLRALYRLQQIDLELDELTEGTGDIPTEVADMEKRSNLLATMAKTEEEKLHALRKGRNESTTGVQELRDRILMLNERLRTVRNNKEYEATTSEIAAAEADLQNTERSMVGLDSEEATLMRNIEAFGKQREELATEMEEKQGTLKMLHETHSEEITDLETSRKEVLGQVNEELLRKYNHIRSAYPDAVVRVRKGACSGCYRAVTAQIIVEMRRNEQMFTCEHCGRILVDDETMSAVVA